MRVRAILGILIVMFVSQAAFEHCLAQATAAFNQRDDEYRLLGLKRAKEMYEAARAEWDRQKKLHDRDLISDVDLERSRRTFADAEVNFQQSLLAVIFEEQFVSVMEAVKYQADDGSKHVRLKIANTSGGGAEFSKLINLDDELFRSLQPDVINNIYVSLLNDENAIISQPYEVKIDRLLFGKPQNIDFRLLQDLDALTVRLIYANGAERNMKIYLQKDKSVDRVVVQSEQFSQEVDLGEQTSFDLNLELFSGTSNTFSLAVVGLPREITRTFMDAAGRVRLSRLKFTETTHSKRASLLVTLPDRPTSSVKMDEPISFYVIVVPRDHLDDLSAINESAATLDDIKALDVGFVRLELIPRGRGELLVKAPQLYHAISPDDAAEIAIDLVNEGSHRLDNIEIDIDLPLDWIETVAPRHIESLEIGEERRVTMKFDPPVDVAVGRYEARIKTSAMSASQPVLGEDKTVTVEIKASTNILATTMIVLLIVGLVGGIVFFGVRLSRR